MPSKLYYSKALARDVHAINLVKPKSYDALKIIAACAVFTWVGSAFAQQNTCVAQSAATLTPVSAATLTPVIELHTSEGCSSCPPADQWLSTLKTAQAKGQVVAQSFHVNYWDYIGWKDPYAAPVHTTRQRALSAANRQGGIYTPQFVRNGQTVRDYAKVGNDTTPALVQIVLHQTAKDSFEAAIAPKDDKASWSAYYTVTEHNHTSRVTAGENKGETLAHDFVVRQYVPLGNYTVPSHCGAATPIVQYGLPLVFLTHDAPTSLILALMMLLQCPGLFSQASITLAIPFCPAAIFSPALPNL